MRGLDDVRSWLKQGFAGTVETAAAPFWQLLPPTVKIAVVRRPVADVIDSLMSLGVSFNRSKIEATVRKMDAKLAQIERRVPGVLSVNFADLADEATCARLFEYCLPFKHDHEWWARLSAVNLQVNFADIVRYQLANAVQISRAASICAQEIRSRLWSGSRPTINDGMTFQQEPFDKMWPDAQRLFAEHCAAVGEPSDEFTRKNIALLRKLDQVGALEIMTARCNGRMFGYLVTVLGPSLEAEDVNVAQQTTFYASPDAKGVGMRLQRASIAALKARGGNWDVLQRAGVRGDGARLGIMYKRMGAEDVGTLSRISLRGA